MRFEDGDEEDMSRADIFRLLDDGNNRGDLITAVHGERVGFMDSLDSSDDAKDDINEMGLHMGSS